MKKELRDVRSSAYGVFTTVKDSWKGNPSNGQQDTYPKMIDPVRFKKILVTIIKILILAEILGALTEGLGGKGWSRLGFDLLIAGILYIMWDKIKRLAKDKKAEYRLKMEASSERIKLWDALAFSLLWMDEIRSDIPADRKRLVVISYTLIALGVLTAFIHFGEGMMALVISGALVLGAVNLLSWVVSLERGEKETLQTELKLAHDVQVSLMPKQNPDVQGHDLAGFSLPAKEVGGDHFDYCYLGPDRARFGISIFDVSGKGMQAAMSAVFTSGAFVSEAKQSGSPAEILTRLNKSIYAHSKRGHFIAFLFAALDTQSKILTIANAGQTKPLLKSGDTVRWLDSAGVHFPLGMREDSVYQESTFQLREGDVLILVTDGFTEAMNAAKEMYGAERLEQTAKRLGSELTAQQIVEAITANVKLHVVDTPQHDDMTMVVVKVK